jgi:hypothetical protein
MVVRNGRVQGVNAITVANGRIATMDLVLNPEKLKGVAPA